METGLADAFAPGDIVAGRYRIERIIGQGGMGIVVAALHVQLEQRFAIKFLLGHPAADGMQTTRFFREARAAAQIKSEHVARVVDTGTLENGAPYIVMECLDGRDLANELSARGPLPIEEAVDYVLQACEAIADAHALGIVHRDLKPANLFLSRRSDGSTCVKVLDFGISKVLTGASAEPALTATTAVMGSPMYMSPEQIRSSKMVDARSDVWSLGVILFELVCGRPPFRAETVSATLAQIIADPPPPLAHARPGVPAELEAVILGCLEKEASNRTPSVAILAERLLRFAPSSAGVSVERILRLAGAGQPRESLQAATPSTLAPKYPQTSAAWGQTGHPASGGERKVVVSAMAGALVTLILIAVAWLWTWGSVDQVATAASSPPIPPPRSSAVLATASTAQVPLSPPPPAAATAPVPIASEAAVKAGDAPQVTSRPRVKSGVSPHATTRASGGPARAATSATSTPPFGGRL